MRVEADFILILKVMFFEIYPVIVLLHIYCLILAKKNNSNNNNYCLRGM